MFCPNCHAEIPDNVRFCTQCGAPVQAQQPFQPTMPQDHQQTPYQPAMPQDHQQTPYQPAMPQNIPQPAQQYGAAPVRRKLNPLAVVIPAACVLVLAAAAVLYFLVFSKPPVTLAGFKAALEKQDFQTALEMSEKLPESDCEEIVEDYITDLFMDTDNSDDNDMIVQKMFDIGFDKYEEIYADYQSGGFYPPVTSFVPGQSSEEAAITSAAQEDVTSAPESAPEPVSTTSTTAYPTEEPSEPELSLEDQVVGHWRREVRSGCYEDIVFINDGTGYIYSDIMSEKVSDTSSRYLYHDGKIHFEWSADDGTVNIDAEINPYCFVAYQGYAAPGHYSIATWKGSKNGSHDYSFAYDTEDEYLCDMLGISSVNELYSGRSLTRDYWTKFLPVASDAWNMYFYNRDQVDMDKAPVDYSTLASTYQNSTELRAQYEDVDLYHFVPFTKMLLVGTDNPTTISLEFNMEDYERAD